ncbi:MAG: hypothetical protein WCJ01_07545 [Ignavibacteria bacterium]
MIKIWKIFVFIGFILPSTGSVILAEQFSLVAIDSVNIKAMLQSQIIQAKEEMKKNMVATKKMSHTEIVQNNTSLKSNPSKAGLTDDLYLKIFLFVDATLSALLFVLWRRRKENINKVRKSILKNNIMKLREEKVKRKSDKTLDSNRKILRLDPAFSFENEGDQFIKHARKMSVSVGEFQLAARIKSYKTERG